MAKNKTRNEIIYYSIFGAVILAGSVALMLFGANKQGMPDLYALLAGLAVSIYVFRFGLPWKWLNFLFLASFLVVGMLLGSPGLMWCGGYIAGSQFGVAWRLATVKPKVKSNWTVNGKGIDTEDEARKVAREELHRLDGEKHERLVVEHGSARFEVAGALASKLVCHRNRDSDNEDSWAILSMEDEPTGDAVKVPMGSIMAWIPSEFVHGLGGVESALNDFMTNPKSKSLGSEWNTKEMALNLRLSL